MGTRGAWVLPSPDVILSVGDVQTGRAKARPRPVEGDGPRCNDLDEALSPQRDTDRARGGLLQCYKSEPRRRIFLKRR